MMSCRELAELLLDYVAGDLPPEHRERIDRHLRLCPPCVVFIETYQCTIRLTRRLPQAPVPPELMRRLCQAAEEIRRQQPPAEPGQERPPS